MKRSREPDSILGNVFDAYDGTASFQSLLMAQRNLLANLKTESNWQKLKNKCLTPEPPKTNFLLPKNLPTETQNNQYNIPADLDDPLPLDFEDKMEYQEDQTLPPAKRRKSTLSLLDTQLVEESQNDNSVQAVFPTNYDPQLLSDFPTDQGFGAVEQDIEISSTIGRFDLSSNVQIPPSLEPSTSGEVKEQMEAFQSAMGDSLKSQQQIHDWDRKMGLKRSHSKTMRLSMRSRKQLRNLLKKDIRRLSNDE